MWAIIKEKALKNNGFIKVYILTNQINISILVHIVLLPHKAQVQFCI